jgi:hypothetical protein
MAFVSLDFLKISGFFYCIQYRYSIPHSDNSIQSGPTVKKDDHNTKADQRQHRRAKTNAGTFGAFHDKTLPKVRTAL